MTGLAALLGMVMGASAVLGLAHATNKVTLRPPHGLGRPRSNWPLACACGAGAIALLVTRWPVAALAASAVGYLAPRLLRERKARAEEAARIQALAEWAEMLRDTMAAASGLEEAIRVTAPLAPLALRSATMSLAARLQNSRIGLTTALRMFARDVADPTCDLVVAALLLPAGAGGGRVGEVLGELAIAAHAEVTMRQRVETGRARVRASVRMMTLFTLGFTALLMLLNRPYLDAYEGLGGQLMLAAVFACYGGAYWWLAREGQTKRIGRFLDVGDAA